MSDHNPWQEPVIHFYERHKHSILFAIVLFFSGIGLWEYQKEQTKAKHAQLTALQTQWIAQNQAKDPGSEKTLEAMMALDKSALITQLVMASSAKNELAKDPQKAVSIYQDLLNVCQQPFCDLYRLRLSVIYINLKAPNEAIHMLNLITQPSFINFRELYLGDAHQTLDQKEQAIAHWKKAYSKIPTPPINPVDKGIKDQLTYRLQKELS